MPLIARVHDRFDTIGRAQWGGLDNLDNPFLAWRFLNALESSGSVGPDTGWQPHHLCLYDDDELVAAAPTYLKSNSRGEFVFDWAWADAYQRHGHPYYPKLLTAVPWSPVTGPRILVRRDGADPSRLRRALVQTAAACCQSGELSSWHCNFPHPSELEDIDLALDEPVLQRFDWQFHWINDGYEEFDDFLSTLKAKKRKNIRHERRDVAAAGVRFDRLRGRELGDEDIEFICRCYRQTFREHGNFAALTRAFFRELASQMGDELIVAMARHAGERVAMALFLEGGGRLYGRYWGATQRIDGLHFETAYYQGIEHCIEHRLEVFESGAQGEHKLSRGFTPVMTHSRHLVRHPGFRQAIADHLEREHEWLNEYRTALAAHSPYAAPAA